MRIVVTGAHGFIAKAVVKTIQNEQIDVIKITRCGEAGTFRFDGVENLPSADVLLHFAESPNASWVNDQGEAGYLNASNLIDEIVTCGKFRSVVYPSSALVYAKNYKESIAEDEPLEIKDYYSKIKIYSENKVLDHGGCVVRLSNVYGLGMSKQNLMSSIIQQISESTTIMLNSAEPIRDFVWIDDVARIFSMICNRHKNDIFNCSTGIGTSVGDLLQKFLNISGLSNEVVFKNSVKAQKDSVVLSPFKSKKEFGWRAQTSIDEGIKYLLDHKELNS